MNLRTPEYPRYGPLYFRVDDETGVLRTNERFEFERIPGHPESVPADFPSDLASIPLIIRAWFPPWGKYTKAALVHDMDYRFGGLWKVSADLWFFQGMRALGVPIWKASLFSLAVLCFGWIAWYRLRLAQR